MPLNLSQQFTGQTSYPSIYTGSGAQFLSVASVLSIYAVMDAGTAGDTATMALTLNQGGQTQQPIPPGYVIGVAQTVGGNPRVPDDVILSQYAVPGNSQLMGSLTASAATDKIRVKTYITP